MRRFFWAPKTYAKKYGVENIYNFTQIFFAYLNLCLCYGVWYDTILNLIGTLCILAEREMSDFWDDHALPDTSMRLSDYVLQTFPLIFFSLAIAIFSIFKMANGNFKMAAKFIY